MPEPKVLLDGLGIPESPRWHDGRLWFANWIDQQIVSVGADGDVEVVPSPSAHPMGWSIDWLPDGSLLTTGDKLRRRGPDGSFTEYSGQGGNEIVADGHGNVYLNGADFDFAGGEAPRPGYIRLVTPDGTVREVADDIQFPNGMVISPDDRTLVVSESFAGRLTAFDIAADGGLSNRRTFADGLGPDGICVDADGAIWVSAADSSIVRVTEGGEILQRIDLSEHGACFALALGGPDRRTLYILTAEWRSADSITDNLDRLVNGPRTGEVLSLEVAVPGAGRP
ncbi:SMP-30/Gluconolaconase/LRE domain protein [Kribbella flavida DSM 17836]|uniref:SMP-30/Gluconolaconase/LRE domain protein n=1 Tax=Kribbella flavida (strain DSM 17836 / JCM 10339 / NBRC 14399) TaxID=479435 RepID=D2PKJ6_KRIFD|nr:SMP-30/gluconolactonase/LRE family protein [Kribbella flavida]ADB30508.1 SMP-30/Gluconolaconase/LRE domain protein [Kribbella flavida DSM 17836]